MSLVKWIRKNNRKIMTFVVIFCMVAFIIGSFGLQMLSNILGGGNRLIATYDAGKIKQKDFMIASNELNVLKSLMADRLLIAQGQQSLAGPLLVKLIFPDSQFAGDIAGQLKQAVQQGQLPLTNDELDDYFNQPTERAEILWILLRDEAYSAGCITPTESARQVLKSIVPQMTGGQFDAASMVKRIIGESNITEEKIVRVFADLLSVVEYANFVMNNEAVTLNQVRASVARGKERIDADFVKFAAEDFVDENAEIADADLQKQFDAYKDIPAGMPTAGNPFGFGYKLPKRVKLEYIVVKMDDVQAQTAKVTSDEMENYYSRNLDRFTKEEPVDPANPESEKKTVTQSFSEVENQIRQTLVNEKTQSLANMFFNDIKDLAGKGFEEINLDEATVSQLQEAADKGTFDEIAQQVSVKHKIPAAVGKTGLLSPQAFGADDILGSLGMQYQRGYLRLPELAFAVTEEPQTKRRIGLPSMRIWQTIGPVTGGYYDQDAKEYYRLTALVRVIDIEDEATPENLNVTYDTRGIVMFDSQTSDAATYSVKEQVKEDVAMLAGMKTAQAKADELAALIADKGWDEAIKAYNEKYADDTIELDSIKQQTRVSQVELDAANIFMKNNPARADFFMGRLSQGLLANKLYAMLAEDAETTGTLETVMAFEPDSSCYVVKEVIRQPATTKDYEDGKAQTAMQLAGSLSMDLPLVHFSTENILKRMDYDYKMAQPEEETGEAESQDTEKKDEAA